MRQATADPTAVRAAIAYLEPLGSQEFANALARCIMVPPDEKDDLFEDSEQPITKAAADRAFRSTILIERAIAAAELLIAQARNRAARDGGTTRDQERRRQHYIDKVGHERKVLGVVLKGYKAQNGIVDNAPNPTGRAKDRLWQLALQGPVPAGTALRLRDEEMARLEARKAAEKAARKAARRRSPQHA